jgi:hypothetical protein
MCLPWPFNGLELAQALNGEEGRTSQKLRLVARSAACAVQPTVTDSTALHGGAGCSSRDATPKVVPKIMPGG